MEYNGNPESVGYKIKYSRADGHGKTLSHVVQDRVEREYTIEDLEEWTEYRVQVQAFNAIGSGPWSQTVMGRTRESGTRRWPRRHFPVAWGYPRLCLFALRAFQGHKGWSCGAERTEAHFPFSVEHAAGWPRLSGPAPSQRCSQRRREGAAPRRGCLSLCPHLEP